MLGTLTLYLFCGFISVQLKTRVVVVVEEEEIEEENDFPFWKISPKSFLFFGIYNVFVRGKEKSIDYISLCGRFNYKE